MDERYVGNCVVCQGDIVERSYVPYVPRTSRNVYGPGSENVATEECRKIDGYHCIHCGLEYHKPPTTKEPEFIG